MQHDEIERLRLQGMAARRAGLSLLDNPFLEDENMFEPSPEGFLDWLEKAQAWSQGWSAEDHAGQDAPPKPVDESPGAAPPRHRKK